MWNAVATWFNNNIVQPIQNFFSNLWNSLKNGAQSAWNGIKNVFSSIGSFFSGIWNTIKSTFTSIGTKIGDAIGGAFKSAINAVISTVEKGINFVPNSINKAIKLINKLPGVNIPRMSTISLPRLATGTVIPPRQEFAAILGDQKHGTNIEAPLDTIKQANREVLEEFMSKYDGMNSKDKEIVIQALTIINRIGNNDLSKTVVKGVRIAEKDLGKPLFVS